MIQSYYLHVWTTPAQFVSNGVQNNHVNYLASRSEWQQLLPEAAMRTHCFSQPNTLSKFNQSCLNDDYIWKEVSKSLWWATHMNSAGISKAQRGERYSSPLVYSTTRVSLPLSVRDLLWKHPPWSSKLSIILDTCWRLTQKPNTWRLCLSISCCDSYRKSSNLQCSALSPAIWAICIYYSPSLLSVCWPCKWCTGDTLGWDRGGTLVTNMPFILFKPLIYIFGEAKKQRIYDSPLTFHQITSIL